MKWPTLSSASVLIYLGVQPGEFTWKHSIDKQVKFIIILCWICWMWIQHMLRLNVRLLCETAKPCLFSSPQDWVNSQISDN
jgi:hypothetical protein